MTTEQGDQHPDQHPDERQALKDELWGQGVPDAAAEELLTAWEAHAREAGVTAADPGYWTQAAAWIDGERGAS